MNPFADAKWLAGPNLNCKTALSAPIFRKIFFLDETGTLECRIAGVGFYELYINRHKVGNAVLNPVFTRYDVRVNYDIYDITEYLQPGENLVEIWLGNGWYNCIGRDSWHFESAPYRAAPRFIFKLCSPRRIVLVSDSGWECCSGPICFNAIRHGETFDARIIPGSPDAPWNPATITAPPGGELIRSQAEPCRVIREIPSAANWQTAAGATVYDFGENLSGWVAITVAGEAGAQLTIRYAERLDEHRNIDQSGIALYVKDFPVQCDTYILKGMETSESWSPRFVFHGFRYVEVNICGNAVLKRITARQVRSGFAQTGHFSCDNQGLNWLVQAAMRSYEANFVGLPSDCPHREKNGWTADAHLAAELGLSFYDAQHAYREWVRSIVDAQRPSGQVPGIVPFGSNGWHWNYGPVWDSALILIPYFVYLHTADPAIILENYPAMRRYLNYCESLAEHDRINYGPGDWNHPDGLAAGAAPELLDTAFYYEITRIMAFFARLLRFEMDFAYFNALARRIKIAFNRHFYRGGGVYGRGEPTAQACALVFDLAEAAERQATAAVLNEHLRKELFRADFGIVGAKYIPRALTQNGYIESAIKLFTQPEYPGWGYWHRQGATTLYEQWNGESSQNHVMFGDGAAWCVRYLAGICPDESSPGFQQFNIAPVFSQTINKVDYRNGSIAIHWQRQNGQIVLSGNIPPESDCILTGPDGISHRIKDDFHRVYVENIPMQASPASVLATT